MNQVEAEEAIDQVENESDSWVEPRLSSQDSEEAWTSCADPNARYQFEIEQNKHHN